jgi:hypothetical protein
MLEAHKKYYIHIATTLTVVLSIYIAVPTYLFGSAYLFHAGFIVVLLPLALIIYIVFFRAYKSIVILIKKSNATKGKAA